jgi:hypothetical protein
MKKTLIVLAAAMACMLATTPATAGLVSNGGFENDLNPLTDWSGLNSGRTMADANSGSWAGVINPPAGSLLQLDLPLIDGVQYTLSFYAKDSGNGLLQGLAVTVGEDLLGTINPTTSWQQYSFNFTADDLPILNTFPLLLGWASGIPATRSVYIDDVSFAAVPEPTTIVAGALLLLPFGLSAVRRFRK